MTIAPRPKRYPPPEFPPRQPTMFAKTPPAIFPSILGLLGLVIALRLALARLGWDQGLADLLAGIAVALWLFAAVAYLAKIGRRSGVVVEDLRVLPGRSGLAAMTMGGMASATLIAPYVPETAWALMVMALMGHLALAVQLIRLLVSLPPPGRDVNPTWHLSFVGFIVAAPAALATGWGWLAVALFWATLPVALVIWGLSALQFLRQVPPAPLRPLLAIHVAPAALIATVAALLGMPVLAGVFVVMGAGLTATLAVSARWVGAAGVSPLWGAFTFPLAALATAMLVVGGVWTVAGLVLTAVGLGVIPAIAWWVLKRWPGGKLAAVTNAAEA
ncbi:tellurium resistance protein [Tabrizicola sp.]|uniref:SLAC1 family transporter n=1 Tax=Tabrizicola sp. TaxID=2005166 RepID=UPI002734E595|nr:tellurium resistance protein [Tabrizicola sp.]MDP3195812.1 tellurium resistance protein [Tabrizicola sp.]